MKKIVFLCFLFFTCIILHAQTMEEVVYLKNGSIIRGIIIEQVPNQSLKIQTKDRNVFVFKYDEIEKITKEIVPANNDNPHSAENSKKENNYKQKGYTSILEAGYSLGVGKVKVSGYSVDNSDAAFSFRWTNGYQFNQHFSLGLCIGYDIYNKINLLPIMIDVRAQPFKGSVTPSLIINAGKSIGLTEGDEGGTILHPQIGIKTFISKKTAFLFNVGYQWQQYPATLIIYRPPLYPLVVSDKPYYKFITARIGFWF